MEKLNWFLKKSILKFVMLWIGLSSAPTHAQDTRLKDLVNVKGFRSNQLIGLGLVVGLKGTGDSKKSLTTNRAIASMLTKLGSGTLTEETVSGNVAAVVVTTELSAFARIGDRIDVNVSTIGDAKSLAGGTLLLAPIRAGDGEIYVVVQGAVVVGQATGDGPRVLTVARVPNGGIVEKEFQPALAPNGVMTLSLKQPDFTTSARITETINTHLKGFYARSLDPVSIEVTVPEPFQSQVIEFISELEALKVKADRKAVVVLNERTGTVVMGSEATIGPVTIAHGDLSIQIGGGSKKDAKKSQSVVEFEETTVGKLIETMNTLGVKPPDLVGILQAIHAAGALQAELKIM